MTKQLPGGGGGIAPSSINGGGGGIDELLAASKLAEAEDDDKDEDDGFLPSIISCMLRICLRMAVICLRILVICVVDGGAFDDFVVVEAEAEEEEDDDDDDAGMVSMVKNGANTRPYNFLLDFCCCCCCCFGLFELFWMENFNGNAYISTSTNNSKHT